jgi:hypothetical protein
MAADLTVAPWTRLAKLSPTGTDPADLQEAADRYVLTGDVYRAAADLWEVLALSYDTQLAMPAGGAVQSATQDGMAVTFVDPVAALTASSSAAWVMVNKLRAMGRPYSALVHDPLDNPWGHSTSDDWRDRNVYAAAESGDQGWDHSDITIVVDTT